MKLNIRLFTFATLLTITSSLHAQDFGLSFSYFLPKNGEFSTPISPFSIRGVGVDLNKYFAVETGASLYRMSGLNLKGLPFESSKALLGPNFTIFIPAELVFQLRGPSFQFDIKGGGFFFYGFDQRINYGNLDRAIRTYKQWAVANTAATFKNHPGFGYHAGFEFTVYVTSQVGIALETNYLVGEAKFPLAGSISGGTGTIETESFDYAQSKVDMTGLEFAISVIMSGGGGAPKKPKAKRRRR